MKFQHTIGSRSYIAHCETLVNSCYFLLFCAILSYLYWLVPNTEETPCGPKRTWTECSANLQGLPHQQDEGHEHTSSSRCCKSFYSSCLELVGTVMCSFNYLVCNQCQLLCSFLFIVVLTYHFTLHGLKEMKDILLVLICNLVVMFTCAHNDKIACLFYICLPMIWMMSYYVHPTLNHVSLSLDVNECEEIDNTVGMLHGHMFRKWFYYVVGTTIHANVLQ